MRPQLALEWNQEKNGDLIPEKVTCGSNIKVWWKCKEGHEWEAVIASRSSGVGCPYCASRKIDKGFNDLESKCPDVAKEWNIEKNKELKPSMVTASSNKKVSQLLKEKNAEVVRFARLEKGEGIEKKEENFAEEVASMAGTK